MKITDGTDNIKYPNNVQIDMENQKIVNLLTPTASSDVATKNYVDTNATNPFNFSPWTVATMNYRSFRAGTSFAGGPSYALKDTIDGDWICYSNDKNTRGIPCGLRIYQQITGDSTLIMQVKQCNAVDHLDYIFIWMYDSFSAPTVGVDTGSQPTAAADPPWSVFGENIVSTNSAALTGGVEFPLWVKITKVGTTITQYYSQDGNSYTQLRQDTITLPSNYYVGLAMQRSGTNSTAYPMQARIAALTLSQP